MVDCGNLRCFQERRLIKKDLMTWSKKIPLVVGLETIAEHVGSRRKVRKLFEPFNCLEPVEPHDWEPEENCFYCADRIQLLFDAIEKTDSKDGGKILRDHPSLRHLGDVLPFLPQFYTSDYGREILSDIKTAVNESEPLAPAQEVAQKLNIELKIPSVAAGSKQKKEATSSNNGKKGYSDDDLTAAVSEIRNGKLGTRRASSLYGIPRSTLRNKIFKMETVESSATSQLTEDDGSSNEAPLPKKRQPQILNTQDSPLLLTDLLQLSTLQYLAPIAIPYFIKPDMFMLPQAEEAEWEKKLQTVRHKHNLSKASMNHYQVKALAHHKLKPFQYDLIKKLTQERLELERNAHQSKSCDEMLKLQESLSHSHASLLKSLDFTSSPPSKKIKKEGLPAEQLLDTNIIMQSALYKALNVNPFSSIGNTRESSSPDSDIVVPEFIRKSARVEKLTTRTEELDKKTYDSLFKYENTRIGDTLKDIIVKTISEKVKCKLESTDFSGLVGSNSNRENQKAKETILSAFSLPETSSPAKKAKKEASSFSLSKLVGNNSTSSNSSQTKKTRPKRGQYRKYNSQLLTEAVKAVQRGEMSVHRAGSYYGVPHSTLEYKVKERHLLRQKKIKEQQELKLKQEAEEAAAKKEKSPGDKTVVKSSNKTTDSTESTTPPKLNQGPSWLPPFASQVQYDSTAALGLFGSGFSLSTPASELLRKLQHKVQSKCDSGDESSASTSEYPSASEGYVYIS
ncbi:mushroom body large-type Kenyon cell-specific protein 1-like [Mercenaria mercenaria]|uniref:mushroom body large-type Kenyon cell-specific protein 1-like n=1 Tax=Mercenaria mercenaria TaxID=6596 RepID=UPI001E1D2A6D|nr:mushroom body large-type Kenyon cell-specific protein 1-like [Mercenaria mercenaria]